MPLGASGLTQKDTSSRSSSVNRRSFFRRILLSGLEKAEQASAAMGEQLAVLGQLSQADAPQADAVRYLHKPGSPGVHPGNGRLDLGQRLAGRSRRRMRTTGPMGVPDQYPAAKAEQRDRVPGESCGGVLRGLVQRHSGPTS